MKFKILFLVVTCLCSVYSVAGDYYSSGKITSLLGHGAEPAIRLTGNVSPNLCSGGAYGWLLFDGTAQEKQWIYSTALAMALTGNIVTVYTNTDGNTCRIKNIQITNGLN